MSDNQLALFDSSSSVEPKTPLAKMLHAHFLCGGSALEAIRILEEAELANGTPAKKTGPSKGRGSRLPPDWAPSTAEIAYAIQHGMNQVSIRTEAEKFRNYWVAKSGAGATKCDWSATWRNWIINVMERGHNSPRSANVHNSSQGNAYARIAMRLRQSSVD